MSTLLVQSETFDDIADAIRAKTGKVASMTPLEMPQEIASISGGGGGGVTILSGTDRPTSAQGYNGQEYLKYAEVESDLEYITSSGNANLHVGITGTKNRRFELKCNIHGGGSFATPIGARVGVENNAMLLFFKHNGSNNAKYDVNTGEKVFGDITSYFDKIITITLSNDEVRVEDGNGNYISQTPSNVNNFETPEMCLMNLGTSGGGSYGSDCNCYMDIYECKIYENNTLIKYLLPKTNSNNEIGLVDMLSGTFYKANGTVSGTSRTTPLSENLISNAFLKVNGNWQDLIGTDIEDVDLGSGGGSIPFEKEIQHSLVQVQTANPVPVSVTFSKEFSIGFVCGLTADNVGNGDVSFSNGLKMGTISHNNQAQISAGFIPVPANKVLTGFFPYSDGGAYYEILGAIGMSKLPSEHYFGFTSANSNISISLDKVYDHIVVFVGMDDDSSGTTLAMNGNAITMTEESYLYGRYTYHCAVETTSDSNTLAFTYSDSVNDSTIVVFAYNE